MKRLAKVLARGLAAALVAPAWLQYGLARLIFGRERAVASAGQRAARWTGVLGEYLRRALLARILARVGKDVVISFGSVVTKPTAELGDRVYIGAYCVLGDVRIGQDTLIADHVCVPSGAAQHGFDRVDIPIREQPGEFRTIRIGRDCWIGSHVVVLADVGDGCVVAAGSVVTRPVADYQVVAGVPARVIRDRRGATSPDVRS